MEKQIRVNISLEDLDLVYSALYLTGDIVSEAHQSVPDADQEPILMHVREVLFRLKEQDDRWVRAQ
tara:strand:+ start:45 stop:242 length:198 start_codon:yes stop_codon:yes gene_type:complete